MIRTVMHNALAGIVLVLAVVHCPCTAFGLEISNRYRSPRNPERKARLSTDFIVLHTTEAPARSSLNKLSDRGEAHYCITEEGQVYAIVDRDREAFHAGRSMWNGREDIDKYSIGIECVGYHNKAMPSVQVAAIRDLVKMLKAMYRVTDERVVCHSHVAYGAPNKWQKCRHRGRKRCGMLFAMPSMRRALQLKYRPAFDPDTKAGRLTVGDEYLKTVLYGNVDTMAGKVGASAPAATSGSWLSRLLGVTSKPAETPEQPKAVIQAPPKPPVAKKPAAKKPPAKPAVKPAAKSAPGMAVPKGKPKTVADLKAMGFVQVGRLTKANSPLKIVGKKWNSPDTYYTIRGKLFPGNTVDQSRLESGMGVWRRK